AGFRTAEILRAPFSGCSQDDTARRTWEAESRRRTPKKNRGQMKALLLSKYRQLEIADVPEPEPGADEVLVRVAACGICGSDVHGYDGSSGRRIPPIVMGHEAAGRVAKIGAGVAGVCAGAR